MSGNRRQKRRAGYSLLIVPEDDRPTISFRITPRRFLFLKIIGVLAAVHVLAGAVLYGVTAHLWKSNRRLAWENRVLSAEAKRIEKVAAEFARLEQSQQRIRSLLGLDRNGRQITATIPSGRRAEGAPPVVSLEQEIGRGGFVAEMGPASLSFLTDRPSEAQFLASNLPTLLPVEGYLTADFDPEGHRHYGIDIAAQRGSLVRAAGAGFIVFADWTPELGNLIILYHGNGLFSYYGHNARILKPQRTWVRKGEPIGIVGSSGESSGPHLHFEIWLNGKPQDPKEYLLAFARQAEKPEREARGS